MKRRTALFAVWCMLLAAPLRSYAEMPPESAAEPEPPAAAEEAPELPVIPAEDGEAVSEEEPEAAEPGPDESPPAESRSRLEQLLDESAADYQVDMAAYYLTEMTEAAAAGNVSAGRAAQASRDAAIEAGCTGEAITFDDLYLLARVIDSEAGSDWLSDEFRMCVGEVVLNRVASPEFPDTLYDVVYQRGQYSVVTTARFASLAPRKECVDVALRLLQGERRMVPAVVYQADYLQGELFTMYSDWRLGNTYFCLSGNLDLYPID